MKSIWSLLVLSFIFVGCEQQEQLPEYVEKADEAINQGPAPAAVPDEDTSGSDEEDHSTVPDEEQMQPDPAVLKAAAMVSSTAESLRLGDKSSIIVTVMADADFEGGDISLSVDRSNLNAAEDDGYIMTDLAQSTISGLAAGQSVDVMLNLETKTMARSLAPTELKVTISQGDLSKEASFTLEVKPEIEIAIISAQQTPYTYSLTDLSTCFRPHADGVQVIFSNRTNDFNPGSEPCIHTGGTLRHCNTGNRMSQNEIYEVGRPGNLKRVVADIDGDGDTDSDDVVSDIYYDHFNPSDSIGRRLFFNVARGTETQTGRNGNNCQ